MATRNDLTIDWNASPRIITINAPSTTCTMQDLYDTLRWIEAESSSMDDASIVDASGKETLDEVGTKVGITVSLLNAKVGFEARTDWTFCSFNGGNLVAYDAQRNIINPINPTDFVNISKTSSASATLQEQGALQYSSYGDQVTVDITSSNSGIDFPSGTIEYPVNNMQDAIKIAEDRGFLSIKIIGSITLDTGDNIVGYEVKGSNALNTQITLNDGALIENCEIRDCTLTGILDGGCVFRKSSINQLSFVSGIIYECGLNEQAITLGGGAEAMLLNTYSLVSGADTPTIDMNGAGQSLGVRGHSGGLRIKNRTSNDPCSIDLASGHIIIDASCTGDPITLRGSFILTVEAGATQPLIEGKVLTIQDNIPAQVLDLDAGCA